MHFEIAFVFLFSIATAVAIAASRFKVPYTVSLVIAGLVLGATHAFEAPHLTKELLFAVVLPGLLFEAAFHLELKKFLNNKVAIHSLAVPGVIAAIVATGLILTPVADALHITERFTLMHGLVFGALIAATDPIAVVGLFKSLGAPKRLAVLVEGESLLNDGTAVVLFTLILGMAAGGELSIAGAGLQFAKVVGMGALIGLAFGFGASQLIHRVDDPMVEITATTIAAYGSFAVAEQFHYSGVIATVAAGMLCGNFAARTGMTPSTRIAVESFWEYLSFALNSLVFLLIGFEVDLESPRRFVEGDFGGLRRRRAGPRVGRFNRHRLAAALPRTDPLVVGRRPHLGRAEGRPVDGPRPRYPHRLSSQRPAGEHDLRRRGPVHPTTRPDHGSADAQAGRGWRHPRPAGIRKPTRRHASCQRGTHRTRTDGSQTSRPCRRRRRTSG